MKDHLHGDLRDVRRAIIDRLDGLSEYDARRPLTPTGTNLLGLVKHLALWESRYFGEAFGRPFPGRDQVAAPGTDMWATERETRAEILDRYRRVCAHSDATITALTLDSPGHVPWWPRPRVTLFGVLVHMLTETNRHAGHADILREQIDDHAPTARHGLVERAARAFREPSGPTGPRDAHRAAEAQER